MKEELSTEQILAKVFEIQGFLILGSSAKREIGSTISNPFLHTDVEPERVNVALKVIGETNRVHYMDQEQAFIDASGWPSAGQPHYAHYYRCVPQD